MGLAGGRLRICACRFFSSRIWGCHFWQRPLARCCSCWSRSLCAARTGKLRMTRPRRARCSPFWPARAPRWLRPRWRCTGPRASAITLTGRFALPANAACRRGRDARRFSRFVAACGRCRAWLLVWRFCGWRIRATLAGLGFPLGCGRNLDSYPCLRSAGRAVSLHARFAADLRRCRLARRQPAGALAAAAFAGMAVGGDRICFGRGGSRRCARFFR